MLNFEDYNINEAETPRIPKKYLENLLYLAADGLGMMAANVSSVREDQLIYTLKLCDKYGVRPNRQDLEYVNYSHAGWEDHLERSFIASKAGSYFYISKYGRGGWSPLPSFDQYIGPLMKRANDLYSWDVDRKTFKLYPSAYKKPFDSTIKFVSLKNINNYPIQLYNFYVAYIDVKVKYGTDEFDRFHSAINEDIENSREEYKQVLLKVKEYFESKFPEHFERIKKADKYKGVIKF